MTILTNWFEIVLMKEKVSSSKRLDKLLAIHLSKFSPGKLFSIMLYNLLVKSLHG